MKETAREMVGFREFLRELAELIYFTFILEAIFHSPLVLLYGVSLPFVTTFLCF